MPVGSSRFDDGTRLHRCAQCQCFAALRQNMLIAGVSPKHWLEFFAFRLVAWLLGALPVETASWLSGRIWRAVAPNLHRHQRALGNLARAFPDMSLEERELILFGVWENLGRTFAEAFHLREIAASDRIATTQADMLRKMKEGGRGAVFCSAHLSNWELAVAPVVAAGIAAAGIYQKVSNPLVDNFVQATRRYFYGDGMMPKGSAAVRAMVRFAREGRGICIMSDIRVAGGLSIPFFGTGAPTSPFPALLALQQGLPIYVVSLVREKNVRFHVHFTPIELANGGSREDNIRVSSERIQAAIEAVIRAHPDQWMWGQRRWG